MLITTYGDLQNGDLIHLQGYWFVVRDLARYTETLPTGATVDLIRFTGELSDRGPQDIRRTGYNGGRYGAFAFVSCHAERTE